MRRLIVLAAAGAAIASFSIVPAHAYSEAGKCGAGNVRNPATGNDVVTPANPGGTANPKLGVTKVGSGANTTTFYVDDRNFATGNGLWLYQESNGTGKLERLAGTTSVWSTEKVPAHLAVDADTCTDMGGYTGVPDTVIE